MMFKKLAVSSALVLCMVILSGTARADNIPIVNASFETLGAPLSKSCGTGCAYNLGPIPGWTTTAGAGSWMPGSFFSAIPDGSLVGFVNASNSLTQTLTGNSVLANSIYTMSVYVGDRTDNLNGTYTLSLDTILAGVTTTLCTFSGNASSIAHGTFQLEGCTYTSAGSGLPSGDLFLKFTATNGGQLDVDNVSLTVQSLTGVPEPSTVLMLSIGMLFLVSSFVASRKKVLSLTA
ncbi:MAG TPA: PEP-CTERM sorting domain-containing protein [Candidatus Limnocylindrales bacterium]|nr:PEP-CTERM sorting domain-containing protein [Candidatus Limnocylindrales bacterium]